MTHAISDSTYRLLVDLSREELHNEAEDFNAGEASGGNFDDAYLFGQEDGEVSIARMVIESVKAEAERQ